MLLPCDTPSGVKYGSVYDKLKLSEPVDVLRFKPIWLPVPKKLDSVTPILNCRPNQNLERSKLQIQRLPYMETVDFNVVPVPGVDDQVDVDFTVKEQSAGSFNAGLAYGSYLGLQFNIGVTESNFLGTGNQIGLNLNTSTGFERSRF